MVARRSTAVEVYVSVNMRLKKRSEAGSAFVELGLFTPVLILMMVGAVDLARVFFASISLTNAAEVGVLYGSRTVANSTDTDGMANAARADATDLSGVTATGERYCTCTTSSSLVCSASCDGTQRTYVSVQTAYTYTTLAPIPWVPSSIALSRKAVFRVK